MPDSTSTASGFECTFSEYKDQAAEFFRRLKDERGITEKQIEGGLHALRLAFLYVQGTPNERYQAEILLSLAHRHADAVTVLAA